MNTVESEIREIKALAKKFTPDEIEGCITEQLETGENVCLRGGEAQRIISELSKAEFIRGLIEKGMSLEDALRELARRMRLLQKGFKE